MFYFSKAFRNLLDPLLPPSILWTVTITFTWVAAIFMLMWFLLYTPTGSGYTPHLNILNLSNYSHSRNLSKNDIHIAKTEKKTGFNLILIVTYWSWKSVTVVSHIITSKLHNSQHEVIPLNIFAIHFLIISLNLFDLIFLMMQFCYFDFLWSQEKLLSLLCTAAAKYDLVNTKHHWPATVGGMSQNFHQKYRKTPIFLPHTGPRVSFIFSLANFVKIPLFFTRKLVLNVPAVSARHPIWRLSVDGLAASGACRGRSELSFPAITECQGTRDRVGFGNITQIDTQFYVHVLSHTEASCHQQWKKANI